MNRVVAVVVLRSPVSIAELDNHCRAVLAGYKSAPPLLPRDEALPRTAAGKLLKEHLRAQYWSS